MKNIHGLVNYKILLSNHDLINLVYFEGEDKLSLVDNISPPYRLSFENLKKLFLNDPSLKAIFHHLLKAIYHPNLVIFDIERNDLNQYLIYSHAVFNIELLAGFLKEEQQLMLLNMRGLISIFYSLNYKLHSLLVQNILHTYSPLFTPLVWERDFTIKTMTYLARLSLINIHGHNSEPLIEINRRCLDTPIGRSPYLNEETGERIPAIFTGKFVFHSNIARPLAPQEKAAAIPREASLASHREAMFSAKDDEDQENSLSQPPRKRKCLLLTPGD